jgi:hypothetical protein
MCLVSSPLISPYVLELAIDENSSHNAHPYFDFIVQGMVQRALSRRKLGSTATCWISPLCISQFTFEVDENGKPCCTFRGAGSPGRSAVQAYIKLLEGLGSD